MSHLAFRTFTRPDERLSLVHSLFTYQHRYTSHLSIALVCHESLISFALSLAFITMFVTQPDADEFKKPLTPEFYQTYKIK